MGGSEATAALCRHGGLAERCLGQHGVPARSPDRSAPDFPGDLFSSSSIVKQLANAFTVTGQRRRDINEPLARLLPLYQLGPNGNRPDCARFAHDVLLPERLRAPTGSEPIMRGIRSSTLSSTSASTTSISAPAGAGRVHPYRSNPRPALKIVHWAPNRALRAAFRPPPQKTMAP